MSTFRHKSIYILKPWIIASQKFPANGCKHGFYDKATTIILPLPIPTKKQNSASLPLMCETIFQINGRKQVVFFAVTNFRRVILQSSYWFTKCIKNYMEKRKKKKICAVILSLTSFWLSPLKDAPSQYRTLTLFQLKKSVCKR